MLVYVFGNQIVHEDSAALKVASRLKGKVKGVEFLVINPNEDLPFTDEEPVVLMDVIQGADKVVLINEKSIDKLIISKSVSVHDWDLGFQLKYLRKLGKLNKVTIIGLPMGERINYLRIQSILRKLVEQEMQGS